VCVVLNVIRFAIPCTDLVAEVLLQSQWDISGDSSGLAGAVRRLCMALDVHHVETVTVALVSACGASELLHVVCLLLLLWWWW